MEFVSVGKRDAMSRVNELFRATVVPDRRASGCWPSSASTVVVDLTTTSSPPVMGQAVHINDNVRCG